MARYRAITPDVADSLTTKDINRLYKSYGKEARRRMKSLAQEFGSTSLTKQYAGSFKGVKGKRARKEALVQMSEFLRQKESSVTGVKRANRARARALRAHGINVTAKQLQSMERYSKSLSEIAQELVIPSDLIVAVATGNYVVADQVLEGASVKGKVVISQAELDRILAYLEKYGKTKAQPNSNPTVEDVFT